MKGDASSFGAGEDVPNPVRLVERKGQQVLVYEPLSRVNRKAYDWVCHWMKTHQADILTVQGNLQLSEWATSGTKKQLQAKQREAPAFHKSYQKFDKLPLYWITDFMVKELGINRVLVDLIEAHASWQIRALLENWCGICDSMDWYVDLKLKTVFVKFLLWMASCLGDRHRAFKE